MNRFIILIGGPKDGEVMEVSEDIKKVLALDGSAFGALFMDATMSTSTIEYKNSGERNENGMELFVFGEK